MVLLRKVVFVLIIHVLKLEEQFAFAVLLSYQIVYWISTILYQNFIYGSIEFMIQQINELFLTCLILYLMIHKDEEKWGVNINNPWPKNIALAVITVNTCLVLFFQLAKMSVYLYKKVWNKIKIPEDLSQNQSETNDSLSNKNERIPTNENLLGSSIANDDASNTAGVSLQNDSLIRQLKQSRIGNIIMEPDADGDVNDKQKDKDEIEMEELPKEESKYNEKEERKIDHGEYFGTIFEEDKQSLDRTLMLPCNKKQMNEDELDNHTNNKQIMMKKS